MGKHPNNLTTDAEIEEALEAARTMPEPPRIVKATYHPERGLDLFVLEISDGRRLVFPREDLQFVAEATPEQASELTIEPRGVHIWWPQLDEGFSLEGLLEGLTGNKKWMEQLQRRAVAA
jgi:hypothetical protein